MDITQFSWRKQHMATGWNHLLTAGRPSSVDGRLSLRIGVQGLGNMKNHEDWSHKSYTLVLGAEETSCGFWSTWQLLWVSIQLGRIIPTDELIFFRGVGIPPTRATHTDFCSIMGQVKLLCIHIYSHGLMYVNSCLPINRPPTHHKQLV